MSSTRAIEDAPSEPAAPIEQTEAEREQDMRIKNETKRRYALLQAVMALLPTEPYNWVRQFWRFMRRNQRVYFREGGEEHNVRSEPLLLLSTYARDMVHFYGHKVMPKDFWLAGVVDKEAGDIMAAEPDTMGRIIELVQHWNTTGELPDVERVLDTIDRIPLAERRLDWSDTRIAAVKDAVRALYEPRALDDAAVDKLAALLKLAVFDAIGDVPRLGAIKRDALSAADRRRLGAHPNYFESYWDRPKF